MTLTVGSDRSTLRMAAPTDSTSLRPAAISDASQFTKLMEAFDNYPRDPSWLMQARELSERLSFSPTVAARLAHAELLNGRRDEALVAVGRVLNLMHTHRDEPALSVALQVAFACGDLDTVDRYVGELENTHPANFLAAASAVRRHDFTMALARLRDTDDAACVSLRGWVQIQLRDYKSAVADFRRVIGTFGPSPELMVNLGYSYGALGSIKKAISATLQARELSPANRIAAFNLVSFYRAIGKHDAALRELQRLDEWYSGDLKVAFARAEVLAAIGKTNEALRVLRKLRDQADLKASADERAELTANLAYLEFQAGRRSRSDALDIMHRELIRSGYRSLGIGLMEASLMTKTREADKLRNGYQEMLRLYPAEQLLCIRTHLEFLSQNFSDALDTGREWLRREPFSAAAALMVTFLLADWEGDYSGAARVGRVALQRMPANWVLANNVAYSLAMAGHIHEAAQVLPKGMEDPHIMATSALIQMKSGNIRNGVEGYEAAAELASGRGEEDLATLLRVRAYLARATLENAAAREAIPSADWVAEPRSAVMKRLADRLQVPWPAPGS